MRPAPHIILDITALPNAIDTATLTLEDQRFGQHPEQAQSIRWFSRHPDALAMVLALHPKLLIEMREQWPTLNTLLVEHPCKEGIWKAFYRLKKMPYPSIENVPFWHRDALRPLERWMQHQSALLDLASMAHGDDDIPTT
jgi:hypothetical protein